MDGLTYTAFCAIPYLQMGDLSSISTLVEKGGVIAVLVIIAWKMDKRLKGMESNFKEEEKAIRQDAAELAKSKDEEIKELNAEIKDLLKDK